MVKWMGLCRTKGDNSIRGVAGGQAAESRKQGLPYLGMQPRRSEIQVHGKVPTTVGYDGDEWSL